MGAKPSSSEVEMGDTFSEVDETEGVDEELMPRNEEAENEILQEFIEALIDVAPPSWPVA